MANVKLTELTAYTSPVSTDVLPIVDLVNNQTKKVTVADLLKRFGAGTASAPSFSFSGDIDTGIYSPGANQFAVTTGGTQRLLIDASGNTTVQGNLTVNGTTTTVESNTLSVKDKNIEIAVVSTPTDTTADGGGITVKGASDKTINWVQSTGCWTLNQPTNFNNHVRIDSSGRVGMGTDSPGSYNASADNLVVQNDGGTGSAGITVRAGTGAQSTIYFADGTGASDAIRGYVQYFHNGDFLRFGTDANERLRITSDGKMLLGLTTAIGTDGLQNGGSGNAGNGAFYRFDANDSGPFLQLAKSRNGTVGGNTVVQSGDELGTINFQGADGTDYHSGARIAAFVDGTPGNNDMPGRLVFSTTNDGASSPTEKLRITSDGKLGVGTVSPASNLDFGVTSNNASIINLRRNVGGGTTSVVSLGVNAEYGARIAGPSDATAPVSFGTISTSDGTTFSEKVRITSAGNVGIGNSAPGAKLQIESTSDQLKLTYPSIASYIHEVHSNGDYSIAKDSSERLRIDSSGRLLLSGGSDVRMELGTNGTTGTNDRNHLRADGDNLKYNTCDTGNHIFEINGSEKVRYDASGNVTIGPYMTSPYVKGMRLFPDNSGRSAIVLNGTGTDHTALGVYDGNSSSYKLKLQHNGSATFGPFNNASASGYGAKINITANAAQIRAQIQSTGSGVTDLFSGFYGATQTSFVLANGGAYFAGNIGVGTTSPTSALTINSATNAYMVQNRTNCSSIIGPAGVNASDGVLFGTSTNSPFIFWVNNSEKGRVDTSGRFGVNNSSPSVNLEVGANDDDVAAICVRYSTVPGYITNSFDGSLGLTTISNNTRNTSDASSSWSSFQNAGYSSAAIQLTSSNASESTIRFMTASTSNTVPSEKMRINGGGAMQMGDPSTSGNGGWSVFASDSGTDNQRGRMIFYAKSTSGNTQEIIQIYQGTTERLRIRADGGVYNSTDTFGALSDAKLKENIVDASSQWSDIKALQVRNFNLIEGQTHTQIGLIAQEVETVSPGLVSDQPDKDEDGNDLGTVTKAVKYSVLYMKAVKALQEAMARIETLETKVAQLEAG